MLDPACGSGNFLYLALQALKDLEHRVQLEAEALGFQRAFPEVGPANVKGIELNPYAAELARVSVWIGGNPPFLGSKLLITHLGEDYVSRMFATYEVVESGEQADLGELAHAGDTGPAPGRAGQP